MNPKLSVALAVAGAAAALAVYYLFLRTENRRAAAEEKEVERKAERLIRQEHSDVPRPRRDSHSRKGERRAGNAQHRKNAAMGIKQPGK